ncbi:MAG TPA: hypothetical protein VKQ52_21755 [Puia sp.]|nr:hypothetical protein [Puia sp.]
MKKFNKYIFFAAIGWMALSTLPSCKKAAYLKDGGISKAKSNLSTYDYLKGNEYHYFDTVIALIDHFNLKDSVNKAGTFFAFTDFSVNTLMTNVGATSLEEFYQHVSSQLLTQYMFSDTALTLNNATLAPVQVPNWAGNAALSAIDKIQLAYTVYLTNSAPGFDYYTLQYVQINGVLDGSANAPANDPPDTYISCQTTGIQTATGTTLHVLVNNAPLKIL